MAENRYRKLMSIFLLLVICSLLVYIVLRAYYLSFTHDESLSFKIITGDKGVARTANDHYLNTWLMFIFYRLFGGQEIFLRLPNILGFIIYSFFSYKILIKTKNIFLMLLGASLLLLNPYLLDFFSLARGYGLSLGFGLGALYYLFRQESFITYKQYILSLSFSFLFSLFSAYSNLFYINLNISLMIVFLIELYLLRKNKAIQLNIKRKVTVALVFIFNLFFLFILINQIFKLKNTSELNFGGQNNFIDNILTILIHRSIYFSYYGEQFWISIRQMVIAVFAITIVYQICSNKYSSLSKITIMIFLMIFATIMQHYMFDATYPPARSSLIYITLFALLIIYLLSEIYLKIFPKQYVKIAFNLLVLFLLCMPLDWHFIKNINLKYTKEWKLDSNTKSVMKKIIELHENDIYKGRKITISNHWHFEPSINYYRIIYSMDYLTPANRNAIDKNADFIYCTQEEKEKLITGDSYFILSDYKDTKTILLEKFTYD